MAADHPGLRRFAVMVPPWRFSASSCRPARRRVSPRMVLALRRQHRRFRHRSNTAAWWFMEWAGPAATAWIAGGLLTAGAWIGTTSAAWRSISVAGFALVLAPVMWLDRGEAHGSGAPRVRSPGRLSRSSNAMDPMPRSPWWPLTAEGAPDRRVRHHGRIVPSLGHAVSLHGLDRPHSHAAAPGPARRLVICFGTGQTAHAVRATKGLSASTSSI